MDKMLTSKGIKQFLSYFGVGGVSALVEWAVFSLLEYLLDMPYLLATILAFIFSTTTNWFLGRTFTFKESAYKDKKAKEIFLVFLVFGMNTNLLKTIAKILSTGIVFIWNFLSRKLWIYKENGTH